MGESSKIEWTHHTFNPWWGCVRVSEACRNCYAESFAKRVGQRVWGASSRRRFFGYKHWDEPFKWDRVAAKAGERHRVFCASMADVFEELPDDHPDQNALYKARLRLWDLIECTPHLDWLLLTKRPENIVKHAPWQYPRFFLRNVWLGTTCEDQATADERIPHLLRAPATVRFVSAEPLLEAVDLSRYMPIHAVTEHGDCVHWCDACGPTAPRPRLDWVIVGGESGHGARPFDLAWARSLVRQCADAGVACFVKQLGACATDAVNGVAGAALKVPAEAAPLVSLRLKDRKGGDWDEWPADLRVREFPTRHFGAVDMGERE